MESPGVKSQKESWRKGDGTLMSTGNHREIFGYQLTESDRDATKAHLCEIRQWVRVSDASSGGVFSYFVGSIDMNGQFISLTNTQ